MGRLAKACVLGLLCVPMMGFGYDKVVLASPDVGDIVLALGAKDKVVGRDSINQNPAFKSIKAVGMHRNLTVEPILELKPDLVIGSYMTQPSSVYQRLNGLGVKAVNAVPNETVASYAEGIRQIGALLDKKSQGEKLAADWQAGMKARPATQKRYLLSYDGRIVAGKGTVGDELIRLAGGVNAVQSTGLKPLSREGWLAARPDIVIVADHQRAVVGSIETLKKRPELAGSPAAQTGKVFYWPANDFLRFGMDSPQVLDSLHKLAK